MNPSNAKLVCPCCQAEFTLAEAAKSAELKNYSRLAALFGPDWPLVEAYLACFRTEKNKDVRLEKAIILLEDLAKLYRERKFSFNKEEIVVHPQVLRVALRELGLRCDSLIGLKNHNYLKSTLKNKMAEFHRNSAAEERQRIERDRRGERPPSEEAVPPPPEIRETIDQIAAKMSPEDRALNAGRIHDRYNRG